MLVGFACFDHRLAALLENCNELRFYAVETDSVRFLWQQPPPTGGLPEYPALLASLRVDELVCGGVGSNWEIFLRGNGVKLKSWMSGTPEDVLNNRKRSQPAFRIARELSMAHRKARPLPGRVPNGMASNAKDSSAHGKIRPHY